MLQRTRLELSVLAALAVAIVALVLALRGGASEPAAVVQEPAGGAQVGATVDFVPKGAQEVDIIDFAYSPEPVRVRAGESIAWTNSDAAPHTVTARDGSWGSEILQKGEPWVTTFDEPGVYVYICELHPPRPGSILGASEGTKLVGGGGRGMKGTIIVE